MTVQVLSDPEPYLIANGKPPAPYVRVPNHRFDLWVMDLARHICLAIEVEREGHTNHFPCSSCVESASALAYKYAEKEQ